MAPARCKLKLPIQKLLLPFVVLLLYHPLTTFLAFRSHLLSAVDHGPASALAASLERSRGAPSKKPTSPYAIMWILGGVHEDRPSYRGFLYDVLISARLLERQGSTADRILWVQLSPDSRRTALGAEHRRWLRACGVRVRYLEREEEHESFGLLGTCRSPNVCCA